MTPPFLMLVRGVRGDLDAAARGLVARLQAEGWPVSQAVTTGPMRRGISIGLVYTPPEERGRGYATACAGELSRLLLAQDRDHCTLLVEAGNSVAQRVYQRVGYRMVGEVDQIVLEE